jgi:hypothetical protein
MSLPLEKLLLEELLLESEDARRSTGKTLGGAGNL